CFRYRPRASSAPPPWLVAEVSSSTTASWGRSASYRSSELEGLSFFMGAFSSLSPRSRSGPHESRKGDWPFHRATIGPSRYPSRKFDQPLRGQTKVAFFYVSNSPISANEGQSVLASGMIPRGLRGLHLYYTLI